MTVHTPIESRRSGLPVWVLGLAAILFLVGAVYLATNLSGENPPVAIPGASQGPGDGGPDPVAGQAIAQSAGCQACHGQSWEGGVGPALTGVSAGPKSDNLQTLATDHPDTWMQLWIDGTGPEVQDLNREGMPTFGDQLSPEQIDSIVAFLKTL